ncbi:MAG: ORC1-type DNA replication protein [Candidatus Bathyarchaeota archaeon]|nr:ORC1-type DNA replication protein [Candidatus Bathyarchaeum tardum]WNZ28786.1 MAG: ORC1-type DNA replication protein [Candidatus Bathyarchaeota archaeon]
MSRYSSVFKDESKLDINYVPSQLLHRKLQLNLLNQFFRFTVENPGKMTQRTLIMGNIGTGKTVLSQHFGLNIVKEAKERKINLNYIHINCRECKGSLFMILQRTIAKFYPNFPRRGYSAEELLQALMQILDDKDAYLILTLDELESLVQTEGSDPLYNLSRIQEDRIDAPKRLSLICILRQDEQLESLDPSTRSTLQRNIIRLTDYSESQLEDILANRVDLAFIDGTVPPQTLTLIAELGNAEQGNARYSIELLWRAGKYADASELQEVTPECLRNAVASVYPVVRRDMIVELSLHEKLFLLGVARHFKQSDSAHVSMGDAEESYALACEEYNEKPRGHTQLWKYVNSLSATGILETMVSGVGQRGKTTMISLSRVPASDLDQEITKILSQKGWCT